MEKIAQSFRDSWADAVDTGQFANSQSSSEAIRTPNSLTASSVSEIFEQILRRASADMPDAQTKQQFHRIGRAFALNGCQQVIHRLFLPAFARQIVRRDAVCRRKISAGDCKPAQRQKFRNGLLAQSFNIERRAADEMPQPFERAAPGRSARRCSGHRPRLPLPPLRTRMRGNDPEKRMDRAALGPSDSRQSAG